MAMQAKARGQVAGTSIEELDFGPLGVVSG